MIIIQSYSELSQTTVNGFIHQPFLQKLHHRYQLCSKKHLRLYIIQIFKKFIVFAII